MTNPAIHASIHAKASCRSLAKSMHQQETASIHAKASCRSLAKSMHQQETASIHAKAFRRSLVRSMHQQKTRIGPSGSFLMQRGKIDA